MHIFFTHFCHLICFYCLCYVFHFKDGLIGFRVRVIYFAFINPGQLKMGCLAFNCFCLLVLSRISFLNCILLVFLLGTIILTWNFSLIDCCHNLLQIMLRWSCMGLSGVVGGKKGQVCHFFLPTMGSSLCGIVQVLFATVPYCHYIELFLSLHLFT